MTDRDVVDVELEHGGERSRFRARHWSSRATSAAFALVAFVPGLPRAPAPRAAEPRRRSRDAEHRPAARTARASPPDRRSVAYGKIDPANHVPALTQPLLLPPQP